VKYWIISLNISPGERHERRRGKKEAPSYFLGAIEMGTMKREHDNEKPFLGNLTEKEFYDRLHFNRRKGFNRGQK
jgi:hypothetical protein